MASGTKYCPACRNEWERKRRAEGRVPPKSEEAKERRRAWERQYIAAQKVLFSVRIVRQPGQSWDDVLRELRRVEGELRREYGG